MKCPLCKNKAQDAFLPFCSKTCQSKDLLNWLSGTYAVPVVPEDDDFVATEAVEDEED